MSFIVLLIDNFPTKKRAKHSNRKHLSKEAFRKIIYKEDNMWRVSLDRQLAKEKENCDPKTRVD